MRFFVVNCFYTEGSAYGMAELTFEQSQYPSKKQIKDDFYAKYGTSGFVALRYFSVMEMSKDDYSSYRKD